MGLKRTEVKHDSLLPGGGTHGSEVKGTQLFKSTCAVYANFPTVGSVSNAHCLFYSDWTCGVTFLPK